MMLLKSTGLRIAGLFIAVLISILTVQGTQGTSVLADDSSPSSNLVQQILQESASKASQIKQAVDQTLTNREYSGTVLNKDDVKITLDSKGNSLTVITNDYTDFSSETKSKKIAEGDFIVALGDLNDSNELVAKKVVKLAPQTEATPSAYWGKVFAKGPSGVTVRDRDAKQLNINVTSDTGYQLGTDTGKFSDVAISETIIAVGPKDKSGEVDARFIYIMPSGNQKSASPSATPSRSASSSAGKK